MVPPPRSLASCFSSTPVCWLTADKFILAQIISIVLPFFPNVCLLVFGWNTLLSSWLFRPIKYLSHIQYYMLRRMFRQFCGYSKDATYLISCNKPVPCLHCGSPATHASPLHNTVTFTQQFWKALCLYLLPSCVFLWRVVLSMFPCPHHFPTRNFPLPFLILFNSIDLLSRPPPGCQSPRRLLYSELSFSFFSCCFLILSVQFQIVPPNNQFTNDS